MTSYQILGITDERTECDICGRIELKSTVVFDILDTDGNTTGDCLYAGSSCATTLPGFRTTTAAKIRNTARTAQNLADHEAAQRRIRANEILAKYGPIEHADIRTKAAAYFGYNPHMRGKVTASDEIAAMLADARMALAA